MILYYLAISLISLLVTLLSIPLARVLGRRLEMMDHPDELGIHKVSTPRSGGIAIGFGIWVGLISCWLLPEVPLGSRQMAAMGIGGMGLFITGLLDDLHEIKPYVKALGLFGAGLVIMLVSRHLPLLGFERLDFLLGIAVIFFGANALNFLDGMDGLAAGVTVLAGLGFLGLGLALYDVTLACWAAILAGAGLGFWFRNRPPASIFMGDSGSLVLGGILGWMLLLLASHGPEKLAAGIILLSWLILDTGLSVVRRVMARRDLFTGDRGHVYDLLFGRYRSPGRVNAVMYLGQAGFSLLAVSVVWLPLWLPVSITLILWGTMIFWMFRLGMFSNKEAH
jgi:UDP-GlcNAc:undecaprenyl-phosphate GlcNAc-1-phosphate transferase